MSKYIIRLDDASTNMDREKWDKIEKLLNDYSICPLVGVIPKCKDPEFEKYEKESEEQFWLHRVKRWEEKGWQIALHGYEHIFKTNSCGINPINCKSEFAGIDISEQKRVIREGIRIFNSYGYDPKVFFAPAHTFDDNTIEALLCESNIRFISDFPAFNCFKYRGISFVPQQSGEVRKIPFPIVTFCYHPNEMDDKMFHRLEEFLRNNHKKFISFPLKPARHGKTIFDYLCIFLYKIREKNKRYKG